VSEKYKQGPKRSPKACDLGATRAADLLDGAVTRIIRLPPGEGILVGPKAALPVKLDLYSDRVALKRVATAVLLLACLGVYYAYWAARAESGWRWAMEDRAARDGATMVFPLWTVTRVVDADHYEISKVIPNVPIAGDARDLKVGDTVSIQGTFDAAVPIVRVELRELHTLRRYKEALGVFGFVAVAVWLPFAFRRVGWRLAERG
jgi:hypothetical protein